MKAQLLEIMTIISDPDVVHASANAMRKMFDALRSHGFTEDQAMQLLVAHGMGAKVNG